MRLMRLTRRAFHAISISLVLVISFTWLSASPSGGGAEARLADHVPGQLLIKLKENTRATQRSRMMVNLNATHVRRFSSGAEHWRLGPGKEVAGVIQGLRHNPHLEYAEPNYLLIPAAEPDDPLFQDQWALKNVGQLGGEVDADIDAELAWDEVTGAASVVVAVMDFGVEWWHPDLVLNAWTNEAEVNGMSGFDDDGNGYIDDLHGWDFDEDDNNPSPYDDLLVVGGPCQDSGIPGRPGVPQHGTQIAGISGAEGNNGMGVTGVNWTVRIMPLRVLPGGAVSDVVEAVDYARENGADVINASFGTSSSQTLFDAIAAARDEGITLVAAALNGFTDIDQFPTYPSGFNLSNIISVAATTRDDLKLPASNWGNTSVDLGTPGGDILSTIPRMDSYCAGDPIVGPPRYGEASGTSMAAPHVTGTVALMRALDPTAAVEDMKCSMLTTTDPVPALVFRTVTGGRLNAQRAIESLVSGEPCNEPANFQFVTTIHGDPGYTRLNLVSLPYGNPYQGSDGSEQLCEALDLSPTATVTQYDGLGGKLTHECGKQQTKYELLPLKGVEVIERQPGIKQGVIEGWDLPDPSQIQIESLGPGDIGKNLFPVRFNGTAETPEDLCNQCGLSNQAMISRFDGEIGQVESHVCGQLPLWDLVIGEAVLIQEPNDPVTCMPCRYGSPCPEE